MNCSNLSARTAVRVGIGVICFVAAANLIWPMLRLPLHIALLPNEGWIALFSLRALGEGALYPARDAFVFNNYPPLSFYLVGFLGSVFGDNIIAGRLLSLASVFLIAINIGQIVRNLGGTTLFGIFAAVLFIGILSKSYLNYVGVNDPQLFAHAVMTAGFAVFTASPERARNIAIASFLMVCAGFVKHTIFAMPLAATLWLMVTNRRALALWVAFSLVFVALGFAISTFAFGPVFFEQLMFRRPMSLYYVIMLLGWFQGFIIPAALWFVFWLRAPPDPRFRLVSYLLIAACIEFVILRSGDLVSINSLFDCVIAASIAAGLMLSRADESRLFARYGVGATTALIVGALCLKLILLPQNELRAFVVHPDVLDDLRSRDTASRQDIASMRTYEGPAICENLALCYWSGHQSAYDPTASSAAFRLGDRDIDVLRKQISGGQFRLIQLEPRSPLLDAARNSGLAEHNGASGTIIFHAAARAGN